LPLSSIHAPTPWSPGHESVRSTTVHLARTQTIRSCHRAGLSVHIQTAPRSVT
jgi:hypothetical protein